MSVPKPPTEQPDTYIVAPLDSMASAREKLAPGIDESLTYRCFVKFENARRVPVVAPPSGDLSTIASREFGYLLLTQLELLRRTLRTEELNQARFRMRARVSYRRIRSSLAKSFLVPRLSIGEKLQLLGTQTTAPTYFFEASRRVIDFEPKRLSRSLANEHHFVCHLFAFDGAQAKRDLWYRFVDEVASQDRSARLDDPTTDFSMICSPKRVASKVFWEVVIAPRELLLDDNGSHPPYTQSQRANTAAKSPLLQRRLLHGSLVLDMDVEQYPNARPHDSLPLSEAAKVDIDPAIAARSALDWTLIISEVHAAAELGRPLDDALVEEVAAIRLKFARENYNYPARTGAGATLESSTQLVRTAVEIYLLGNEPDIPDHLSS